MAGFNFDLKDQLVFYGSYHANFWNQVVHVIFVPLIIWSLAVWLCYAPAFFDLGLEHKLPTALPGIVATLVSYLHFDLTALLVIGYGTYYIALTPFVGIIWSLFVGLPVWASSEAFVEHVPKAWAWAILVHFASWFFQVWVGHTIAEKRKPALLDSFFQSLVLAPLFITYEVLFWLGYDPTLKAEIDRRVAANIAEHKAREGGAKQPLIS